MTRAEFDARFWGVSFGQAGNEGDVNALVNEFIQPVHSAAVMVATVLVAHRIYTPGCNSGSQESTQMLKPGSQTSQWSLNMVTPVVMLP